MLQTRVATTPLSWLILSITGMEWKVDCHMVHVMHPVLVSLFVWMSRKIPQRTITLCPALTSCSCSCSQCIWKTWKSVWSSVAWRSTSVVSIRWLCSWILENLVNKCYFSLFLKVKPLSARYHHKMCDEEIGGVHIFENFLSPFYLPYLSFGKTGWCGIFLMALNTAATARALLYLLTMGLLFSMKNLLYRVKRLVIVHLR